MSKKRVGQRLKLATLAAVALGGSTVYTSCGWADVQSNVIAGTLGYVKSSATDFWATMIPKWSTLIKPPA